MTPHAGPGPLQSKDENFSMFPPFRERAPWFGADLQTVRNILAPKPADRPGGERLLLPVSEGDRLAARLDRPAAPDERPLVVLVHGLTGSEASVNIVATTRRLVDDGWRVLRLNLRGAGPSQETCLGRYHAGRTQDLAAALGALPAPLLRRGAILLGHSLGGNLVLKYMGEDVFDAPVLGAAVVSTPLDLAATCARMMAPRNTVYHLYMLREMKREALAAGAALTTAHRAAVAGARSVFEFDDAFVAPMFGYRDAPEYYARNSAQGFLPRIRLPTLVVHALDDPWIPGACYECVDWRNIPAIETALSPHGGHLGFHGEGSPTPWHDRIVTAWLRERFMRLS
jgi:uncharacterized protein